MKRFVLTGLAAAAVITFSFLARLDADSRMDIYLEQTCDELNAMLERFTIGLGTIHKTETNLSCLLYERTSAPDPSPRRPSW